MTNGYIHLPGVLTEEECAKLEQVFDAFMEGKVQVPGKDFCDMSQRVREGCVFVAIKPLYVPNTLKCLECNDPSMIHAFNCHQSHPRSLWYFRYTRYLPNPTVPACPPSSCTHGRSRFLLNLARPNVSSAFPSKLGAWSTPCCPASTIRRYKRTTCWRLEHIPSLNSFWAKTWP